MTLAARLAALWREALVAEFHPPLGRDDASDYNNAVAWLGEAAEAAEAGDLGLALHRMSQADAAFDGLEPDGFGDALLELELAAFEQAAAEEGLTFQMFQTPEKGDAERDAAADLLQLQDEEAEAWRKASDRKGYVESPSPSPPPSTQGSSDSR